MHRARVYETARHGLAFGILVLLGNAALSTSCAGVSQTRTCLSPITVSKLYEGDPTATSDPTTWHLGILATQNPPRDPTYAGTVFLFRPDAKTPWRPSDPVGPQDNEDKAVQLAIGNGTVQFGTQIEAKEGSPDCQKGPDTTFRGPMPLNGFSGTHPVWASTT